MAFLSSAVATTAVVVLSEILSRILNSKDEAEKNRLSTQYNAILDQLGNKREQVLTQLANESEDYSRLIGSLTYAAPGGTAAKYRNEKSKEYLVKRKLRNTQIRNIDNQIAQTNVLKNKKGV